MASHTIRRSETCLSSEKAILIQKPTYRMTNDNRSYSGLRVLSHSQRQCIRFLPRDSTNSGKTHSAWKDLMFSLTMSSPTAALWSMRGHTDKPGISTEKVIRLQLSPVLSAPYDVTHKITLQHLKSWLCGRCVYIRMKSILEVHDYE